MEKKKLIRIGLLASVAILSMGFLFSSSKSITHSTPKACKESMQGCCKKEKDVDANGSIDFENLAGKFFSSISY